MKKLQKKASTQNAELEGNRAEGAKRSEDLEGKKKERRNLALGSARPTPACAEQDLGFITRKKPTTNQPANIIV